jgi:hypothetical protein
MVTNAMALGQIVAYALETSSAGLASCARVDNAYNLKVWLTF